VTATIPEGCAAHSARLAEELAARRVCCHACGARVLVGETAHDAEPADDGAERFACAEHCEVCRPVLPFGAPGVDPGRRREPTQ